MEKYKILYGLIEAKKRLTQEEIEKHHFEQHDETTIFKTNKKEEAEEKIKRLLKIIYNDYDSYYKTYTYVRFELVQEVCVDDTPDYIKNKSLGIFYAKFENEEDEEDE